MRAKQIAEKVKGTRRGETLIHSLEKRLGERERERENHSRGARPPNLLNIALCGLASLPFLPVLRRSHPCSKHPCTMRVHPKTKETWQQTSKERNKEDKESMQRTY